MREIKFRVWDNKKMHYGVDLKSYSAEEDGWYTRDGEFISEYNGEPIFMQYTGIKDFLEKEIYESDIIEILSEFGIEKQIISFAKGTFGFIGHTVWTDDNKTEVNPQLEIIPLGCIKDWQLSNMKIIGNIYENPELL